MVVVACEVRGRFDPKLGELKKPGLEFLLSHKESNVSPFVVFRIASASGKCVLGPYMTFSFSIFVLNGAEIDVLVFS